MRSFDSELLTLEASIRARRGHAYLLEASPAEMPGALKAVRRALLCADPAGPCGTCRGCGDGPHPDWVEAGLEGGRSIGRAQVVDWPERALVPPMEAPVRVFVVREAQHLTPEAANLLLKLVEEPPDPVVVVLTSEGPHEVLPTLRSRCRWVALRDPASVDVIPRAADWSQPDWMESLPAVTESLRAQLKTASDPATVRRLVDEWGAVVEAALALEQNANREVVRRRLEFRFARR